MRIYIHRNSQQLGPYTEAEVKTQLASGAISLLDHVWWQGQDSWVPLGQSPLLAPGFTPPPETFPVAFTEDPQPTSKLAIAALACAAVGILTVLPEIAAIVLGHLSLAEIKKDPNLKGRGIAIGSLIVGYLWLLIIIASIAYVFMTEPGSETSDTPASAAPRVSPVPQIAPAPKPPAIAPAPSAATPAVTNSPDQSTNSAPAATNAPDQSTNSPAATTNAPDSSTNSAPMNP